MVSRLSLGAMGIGDKKWRSWVLDADEAKPIVRRALDSGINLIDSCDFYSNGASEAVLGQLLDGFINRDEVLIATKFGMHMGPSPNQRGYSRKHIIEAAEASLRRLRTDRIDLYQTHIWDPTTNIEEMVEALDYLVRTGKVLYVGATDMPAWQFVKAVCYAKANRLAHFVSMQSHYNLVWREDERELFPFCRAEGIGLLPYSPVARGFLSGKARRTDGGQTERARTDSYANEWYGRPEDEAVAQAVEEVARERGASPSQVALAWVLHNPAVHSPVIGPTRVEHVEEAVAALDIRLDAAEIERLQSPYRPRFKTSHG
jgi:aryl-alcohol dehydrogenase (NADP+)